MIRFGSMECQEAAKTTETAARGDGGSWEICAHWMMDAHRREHLLFIWSSHSYSISPIQLTFTNIVCRETSCAQRRNISYPDYAIQATAAVHNFTLTYVVYLDVRQGCY